MELLAYSMQLMAVCLLKNDEQTPPTASTLNTSPTDATEPDTGLIVEDLILAEPNRSSWLRTLLLIDNENDNGQLRREACTWLYRICILDSGHEGINRPSLLNVVLDELLDSLEVTVGLRASGEKGLNYKEYFTLISNLILNLGTESGSSGDTTNKPGLNDLVAYIAKELKVSVTFEFLKNIQKLFINFFFQDLLLFCYVCKFFFNLKIVF